MIDLSNWLGESYRIGRPLEDADLFEEPPTRAPEGETNDET